METQTAVALVKDLFFGVKIRNELKAQGYDTVFAKSTEQFAGLLKEHQPAIGIIDLASGADWDQVREIGQDPDTSGIPVIVFGSHTDVEGIRRAKASGVARVVSNGKMHAELPVLIEKYARAR